MAEEKKQKGKVGTIIGLVLLLIFAGVSVLGFVYYDQIFGDDAWTQSHPTGIGIVDTLLSYAPRLVGSVQALFIALLVLYVSGIVIRKIFKATPRRLTIGKLVSSILKVVIWAAAIIAVLAVWGFNVGALIAGAGVLTLIIGLGMQSLIADVVAGIFLVCDGTIEVGDIITIDGWRGTVQEIGIRCTKIVNYSGDIRVCNNNTITTFINQSRNLSYPLVKVSVAYGEDVSKIEKLFAQNRDKLREKLPTVIEGPDFKGVDDLADSGVTLLFGATCKESDFAQTQRDMRGVIKAFFDDNGVSIPFPQVDLHLPDNKKNAEEIAAILNEHKTN